MRPFAAPGFEPLVEPAATPSVDAWCFAFRDGSLLVRVESDGLRPPTLGELVAAGLAPGRTQYLGRLADCDCLSGELAAGAATSAPYALHTLRELFGALAESYFGVAGRAAQIVAWDRDHRYCGRCGAPTEPAPGERARRCLSCDLAVYPRLAPAVIVRVERGDEILLARGSRFPGSLHSVLAGFVEPGETLEDTVVREVREETSLEIADVRYFGSQPWPFPHSLMIGFTAAYADGELRIDPGELAEAAWYRADALPAELPGRISIARALIDDWLRTHEPLQSVARR